VPPPAYGVRIFPGESEKHRIQAPFRLLYFRAPAGKCAISPVVKRLVPTV